MEVAILTQNPGDCGRRTATDCASRDSPFRAGLHPAAASADAIVCPACAADPPRLPAEVCPCCAQPTPHGEICGRRLAHLPAFDAARTLCTATISPLDRLIQSFKYGHRLVPPLYRCGQLAALAASPGVALNAEPPADIAVPLRCCMASAAPARLQPGARTARPIGRALRLPIDATSCRRTRDTAAQADLAWRERIANVRNAFSCSADYSGRHVVLVDDVMTTGCRSTNARAR